MSSFTFGPVRPELVEHDHLTGIEAWGEEALHVSLEESASVEPSMAMASPIPP